MPDNGRLGSSGPSPDPPDGADGSGPDPGIRACEGPAPDGAGAETVLVDAIGLRCPEPLMLLRNRIRDVAPGAVLRVRATDPSTERDFRDFCRFLDHELLESRQADGILEFLIRKGGVR